VFEAHERIIAALRDRDPERARAAMLRHIQEVDELMGAFCDVDAPLER
jgi:DNA-binding GntR family transcriptional regulator